MRLCSEDEKLRTLWLPSGISHSILRFWLRCAKDSIGVSQVLGIKMEPSK